MGCEADAVKPHVRWVFWYSLVLAETAFRQLVGPKVGSSNLPSPTRGLCQSMLLVSSPSSRTVHGRAVDVWKAVEREIIRPLRPWVGYFMLLEDNEAFTTAVTPRKAVWEPDPAFDGASYADRYVIFFERMVRERLLDAACVVLADKDSAAVRFPSESVSFQAFAAAIHGRCLQFMATNPDIDWGAGE